MQELPNPAISTAVRRRMRSRRGATAATLALMLPVVLAIAAYAINVDIGRMTMVKQLLVNASREGARQASLPFATSESVQTDTLQMLTNSGVTGSVSISPSSLSAATAGSTVTVSADANSVSWMGSSMFMFGKNITAATSMRRESL